MKHEHERFYKIENSIANMLLLICLVKYWLYTTKSTLLFTTHYSFAHNYSFSDSSSSSSNSIQIVSVVNNYVFKQ